MATTICYSRSIVHFHNPFQKTIANRVFGHGMIKLLNPPHTTRIVICALRDDSGGQRSSPSIADEKLCVFHRTRSGTIVFDCVEDIPELLNSCLPHSDTELKKCAKKLSSLLKRAGKHIDEELGLIPLYENILGPKHISRMWEIAAKNDNDTDNADEMLPDDSHPHVKWGGTGHIHKAFSWVKEIRTSKISDGKRFPLEGKWKMEIVRGNNAQEYKVKDSKGKYEGLVLVEENPKDAPKTVEPFKLAFRFGDHFTIYTRAAGPNVLVGQAWKEDHEKKLWAELVIVKIK